MLGLTPLGIGGSAALLCGVAHLGFLTECGAKDFEADVDATEGEELGSRGAEGVAADAAFFPAGVVASRGSPLLATD